MMAYGQRLGERFRVENAPAIVTRAFRNSEMAVTELRCDNPPSEMSDSIRQEDAFLLTLHFHDVPGREYWEDGRRAPVYNLRAGETCLHDLKRNPTVLLAKPYHSLVFYLPRAALDAVAEEANARSHCDLSYKPGAGVKDVTISSLGSLLLPALSDPGQSNCLFVDHVLWAIGVHVAQTYGGMRPVSRPVRGGLAPWQERRAKELIASSLHGVSLSEVARECRLSRAHFSRAFHRSVGVAPHRWLMKRRIEVAKNRLRDEHRSLADVALECGFSDQSHLARVFKQMIGMSPGAWRRGSQQYR